MKSYNLGNLNEASAKAYGNVMYTCWKEHNAALILSETLTAVKKDWSDDLRFSEGVGMFHILTFGFNLANSFGHAEIDALRATSIDTCLSEQWSEVAMIQAFGYFLQELRQAVLGEGFDKQLIMVSRMLEVTNEALEQWGM